MLSHWCREWMNSLRSDMCRRMIMMNGFSRDVRLAVNWAGAGWCTGYNRLQQNTNTHNRFMALWILSGTTRVSRYQKKHSPTHNHCRHQISLSASSIYYDPWHPLYSIHVLYSLVPQSLSSFLWSTSWPAPCTSYSILQQNQNIISSVAINWVVVQTCCQSICWSVCPEGVLWQND